MGEVQEAVRGNPKKAGGEAEEKPRLHSRFLSLSHLPFPTSPPLA